MRNIKTGELIKRFLPYFKKYKWILILDLMCAFLTTICEIVFPLIAREITDLGINNTAALTVSFIVRVGIFYVVLRIIDTAAYYYMSSVGHVMGTRIETDMRRDLFSHLQRLPHAYYDDAKIGQIMARITSDLFDITEFAHHCPEEFFIAGVKIIAAFVILCKFNVWLTLIVFAIMPFVFISASYFNTRMRRAFKESRHQIGEINAQVEDSLLGIRIVKSFANEGVEEEKFRQGNEKFLAIKKNMYRYMAGFHSSTRLFDGIMYIAVVVAGGIFIIKGAIAPADLTAYLLFVSTLLTSIRRIVEFTEQFQRGMTGIERFIEVMDEPVQITDCENAKPIGDVKGDIRFNSVSFRYGENLPFVLSKIDLKVNAGDHIALVGTSGSGKTTLCNLIPRFYDLTEGDITIDGVSIGEVTLKSLRENIGVVAQEVYLFSGTVRENIIYGKENATEEEIIEAAKRASAHDFIMELPQGYDTYVGERGVKLSGGQKQRISIARAFLKNPPIMILDEATSSLDNESERIVQTSLEELSRGRTTFTIAHRLTTIINATKILVLTDDGIEEEGTHEELMAKRGTYYNLYKNSEF
ncbi:MAG: ABC transporter ATP-binding protein [Clostridia bacterium]|nr:ABC transporter ATP-binding protein [Clostridia bacterium]